MPMACRAGCIPGRGARVARDGETVGYLGALHPQLAKALDLDADVHVLELALEPLLARRLPLAQPVPRFPSVRRDIAMDLPEEISWSQIEQAVRGSWARGCRNCGCSTATAAKGSKRAEKVSLWA